MGVEIDGLCKAFGGHRVLRSLDLRLADDGIYCLMAPSGTGKTTLLRIMLGLETKDAGTIRGIKPGEIAAMFQENRLCEQLTPVENVALVCPGRASRAAIRSNLELILPADCMEQPVSELSGGMKRRVALARAMNYPGKMILLDEPFTGLDKETKQRVIAYILSMRNRRIVLAATHGEEDAALLGGKKIILGEG
ncbi:ABC transporter ATP-binding protein [Cohnella fermenti]|uniref:ABC transporter ATP-binding protein n=1 Tax=Cohnella fermenti TaxID=2565925 RepID=A0A4V3WG91_9BACL|nr:ATP-binding cassette domain-containing protein [Cohnella fermenti]THF83307.1 ABC transporter ATP-binding protein [Cohnella fermenti]